MISHIVHAVSQYSGDHVLYKQKRATLDDDGNLL